VHWCLFHLGSLLHFGVKQCVECYLFPSPCLSSSPGCVVTWNIQLHFILVELCDSCLVELVHVLKKGLCAVFSHAGLCYLVYTAGCLIVMVLSC